MGHVGTFFTPYKERIHKENAFLDEKALDIFFKMRQKDDRCRCRHSTVVVQRFCKPKVGSSNLSAGTIFQTTPLKNLQKNINSLDQCLEERDRKTYLYAIKIEF